MEKSHFRTLVSTLAVTVAVFGSYVVLTPTVHAIDILPLESFGTGGTASNISGWDDPNASAQAPWPWGEDTASPNGGRFAKIGKDGWICRVIDATGYTNLKLSYYWRGDNDAENDDRGIVEYKAGNGGCNAGGSWPDIRSHNLDVDNSWSTQAVFDLPAGLDDTKFRLRFRTSSSQHDEYFRVDGVLLTGQPIVLPPNEATITVKKVTTGGVGTFSFTGPGENFFDLTTTEEGPDSETFTVTASANYTITESDASGWQLSDIQCVMSGGEPTPVGEVNGSSVTVNVQVDQHITCTFTNALSSGSRHRFGGLIIQKVIAGPSSASFNEFSFTIGGEGDRFEMDGGNSYMRRVGDYQIVEDATPGYVTTYGGDCTADGNITVTGDAPALCVITNTVAGSDGQPVRSGSTEGIMPTEPTGPTEPQTPTEPGQEGSETNSGGIVTGTLVVQKLVVGASVSFSDFTFHVGSASYAFDEDGINEFNIASGQYTLLEDPAEGYTTTYAGGCADGVVKVFPNTITICFVTNTRTIIEPTPVPPTPAPQPIIRATPTPTPTPELTLTPSEEPSPTPTETPPSDLTANIFSRFWHWLGGIF